MPEKEALELFRQLTPTQAAAVIAELVAADAAGFLELWPTIVSGQAAASSALLRYEPESAGGIMDSRFVIIRDDETTEQSLARVRSAPVRPADDVSYIYVTDAAGKLGGVVSLRDLVFSPADRRISEMMNATYASCARPTIRRKSRA